MISKLSLKLELNNTSAHHCGVSAGTSVLAVGSPSLADGPHPGLMVRCGLGVTTGRLLYQCTFFLQDIEKNWKKYSTSLEARYGRLMDLWYLTRQGCVTAPHHMAQAEGGLQMDANVPFYPNAPT